MDKQYYEDYENNVEMLWHAFWTVPAEYSK